MLLNLLPIGHSQAGTWNETFDDVELKGWTRIMGVEKWRVRWEVVEGILFSRIRRGEFRWNCDEKSADFMHWTAHEFRLDSLTVIGSEIFYPPPGRGGWGDLALFLGKQQPEADFAAKGYYFSPEKTSAAKLSEKEGYSKGQTISVYDKHFQSTTKQMKVTFNSGKFRVWTGTELLKEFVDNTITEIDVVGVLITCSLDGDWFGGSISGFAISGGGIPNHNLSLDVHLREKQLTTTWGHLKQFE